MQRRSIEMPEIYDQFDTHWVDEFLTESDEYDELEFDDLAAGEFDSLDRGDWS